MIDHQWWVVFVRFFLVVEVISVSGGFAVADVDGHFGAWRAVGFWNRNLIPAGPTALGLALGLVAVNFLGMMCMMALAILESKGVYSYRLTTLVGFWAAVFWPVTLLPMARASLQPWSRLAWDAGDKNEAGGISVLFGVVAECLTIIPLVSTVALRRPWLPRSSSRAGARHENRGRLAQAVALFLNYTDLNSRSAYLASMAYLALASVNVSVISPKPASIISVVFTAVAWASALYWPPSTTAGGLNLLGAVFGFAFGNALVVAIHNNSGALTAGQVEIVSFVVGLAGAALGVAVSHLRTMMIMRTWESRIRSSGAPSGVTSEPSSSNPTSPKENDTLLEAGLGGSGAPRSFRNVSEMIYASSVMISLRSDADTKAPRGRVAPTASTITVAGANPWRLDLSDKGFSKGADVLVEEFKLRKATSPVPVFELVIAAFVQQYHAPISWSRASNMVRNLAFTFPGLGASLDLAILRRCVSKSNSSSSGSAFVAESSGSETAIDDDLVLLFEASAAFWAAVLRGEPAQKLLATLEAVPGLVKDVEASFQAEMSGYTGELRPVLLGSYVDFCDFVRGDPILASNYRKILAHQLEDGGGGGDGRTAGFVGVKRLSLADVNSTSLHFQETPALAARSEGSAPPRIARRDSVRSHMTGPIAPEPVVGDDAASSGELKSLIRASESKIPSYLLYVIFGITALALLSCFVVVLATAAASSRTESSTELSWNSNIVRTSANIAAYALRSLEARGNPRFNGTNIFGLNGADSGHYLSTEKELSDATEDPLVELLHASTENLTVAYSKAFLESPEAKSGEIADVWLRRAVPITYSFTSSGVNLNTNMTLNTFVNELLDSLNLARAKLAKNTPLNSSDVMFVVKNTILAGNPLLDTASSAVSDAIATMKLNSPVADKVAYALLAGSAILAFVVLVPMFVQFRVQGKALVRTLHCIPVNEVAKARNKCLELAAAARARKEAVTQQARPGATPLMHAGNSMASIALTTTSAASSQPQQQQQQQQQAVVAQASAVDPLQRVILTCVVIFLAVVAVVVFVQVSLEATSRETFVGNIEIINAGQRLSHSSIQVTVMAEGTRNDSQVWTRDEIDHLFDDMVDNIEECAGHTHSLTFGGAKDTGGASVFTDTSRSEFLPGFLYKKGYERETARTVKSVCEDLSSVKCGSELSAFERFQSASIAFARGRPEPASSSSSSKSTWTPDVDNFGKARDLYLQRLRPGWLESGLWFGEQPQIRLQARFSLYFSLLAYTTVLCVMGWVFVLWPSLSKAQEETRTLLQVLTTLPGQVLKESSEVTALVGLSVGTRGGSGGGGDKGKNQLGAKELEIFQAGLSVSEDPAFLVDLEGCVVWCSQSVGKNFGGTSMDALGKPIASFLADYRCMSFILDLHRIPSIEVAAKTAPLRLDRCSQVGREDREFRVRVVPVILNSKLYVAITAKDLDAEKEAERVKNDATSTSSLLGTLLPPSIVRRLRDGEGPIADLYPKATIIFLDLVNFTALSGGITATKLAGLLAVVFEAFDSICESMYIQRIKTIGDGYLAVGGLFDEESPYLLTVPNYTPELRAVHACCRIIHALRRINQTYNTHLAIRVGIHSGPVVAGVILPKKPAFDIFGDSVNIASRCESSGSPGQIHVTETVYLGGGVQAAGFQAEKRSVQFKGKSTESVTYLINPASAPPLPHDFVFGAATQGDSDAIQLPE